MQVPVSGSPKVRRNQTGAQSTPTSTRDSFKALPNIDLRRMVTPHATDSSPDEVWILLAVDNL